MVAGFLELYSSFDVSLVPASVEVEQLDLIPSHRPRLFAVSVDYVLLLLLLHWKIFSDRLGTEEYLRLHQILVVVKKHGKGADSQDGFLVFQGNICEIDELCFVQINVNCGLT